MDLIYYTALYTNLYFVLFSHHYIVVQYFPRHVLYSSLRSRMLSSAISATTRARLEAYIFPSCVPSFRE